jgi:hypothetical protein
MDGNTAGMPGMIGSTYLRSNGPGGTDQQYDSNEDIDWDAQSEVSEKEDFSKYEER